jgi:TMEM199 family protein
VADDIKVPERSLGTTYIYDISCLYPTINTDHEHLLNMVLLIVTPTILSALDHLPEAHCQRLELPNISCGAPIAHDQVIRLARYFTDRSGATSNTPTRPRDGDALKPLYTLNSLLRGTKLYVPPPPPKPEPVS